MSILNFAEGAKLESDAENKGRTRGSGTIESVARQEVRLPNLLYMSRLRFLLPRNRRYIVIIVDYISIFSIIICGVFIASLGALPLVVANLLPADPIGLKDSNQLLSTSPDPNTLSVVPHLGDQGSLPSTSTYDSLESIAATDPAAMGSEASAYIFENEGLQPGIKINAQLRKRQGESCASELKKLQPPTLAPPKPVEPPTLEEQLLTLPPTHKTEPEDSDSPIPTYVDVKTIL